MSRAKVIDVLNRVLAIQRFSLMNYLNEAPFRMHSGNKALAKTTGAIADDHAHYSQRLAEAINVRHGSVNSGSFPPAFMSLKNLDPDHLLAKLIEIQQRNIQAIERCVAKLVEDPQAWSLAAEVLGSERGHLDILHELVPKTEPVPIA